MLITTASLIILSLLDLGPGLIHVFAPDGGAKSIANFTNYSIAEKEILWAFGVFGGQQIFNSFITGTVAFDYLNTGYLSGPILIWCLLRSLWSEIIPKLMHRDLKQVAPNAPGNYKSLLNILLISVGLADEYWLHTPQYI